jgi:hypothetical protein
VVYVAQDQASPNLGRDRPLQSVCRHDHWLHRPIGLPVRMATVMGSRPVSGRTETRVHHSADSGKRLARGPRRTGASTTRPQRVETERVRGVFGRFRAAGQILWLTHRPDRDLNLTIAHPQFPRQVTHIGRLPQPPPARSSLTDRPTQFRSRENRLPKSSSNLRPSG